MRTIADTDPVTNLQFTAEHRDGKITLFGWGFRNKKWSGWVIAKLTPADLKLPQYELVEAKLKDQPESIQNTCLSILSQLAVVIQNGEKDPW